MDSDSDVEGEALPTDELPDDRPRLLSAYNANVANHKNFEDTGLLEEAEALGFPKRPWADVWGHAILPWMERRAAREGVVGAKFSSKYNLSTVQCQLARRWVRDYFPSDKWDLGIKLVWSRTFCDLLTPLVVRTYGAFERPWVKDMPLAMYLAVAIGFTTYRANREAGLVLRPGAGAMQAAVKASMEQAVAWLDDVVEKKGEEKLAARAKFCKLTVPSSLEAYGTTSKSQADYEAAEAAEKAAREAAVPIVDDYVHKISDAFNALGNMDTPALVADKAKRESLLKHLAAAKACADAALKGEAAPDGPLHVHVTMPATPDRVEKAVDTVDLEHDARVDADDELAALRAEVERLKGASDVETTSDTTPDYVEELMAMKAEDLIDFKEQVLTTTGAMRRKINDVDVGVDTGEQAALLAELHLVAIRVKRAFGVELTEDEMASEQRYKRARVGCSS